MRVHGGKMFEVFDEDGELSDETCRHIAEVLQTKSAILKYIEPIAHVLAEAGRASAQAVGDSPHYAIDQWVEIIRDRAHQLIYEEPEKGRMLSPPTIEGEKLT